ncbi:MAG: biotin/lipoyl-containing protein [Candidatus Cloacimonadaceae bacterium]|jgi:biotin carboxyl carrier protein|nr:biotin/lipoyl-binding protein [Candidatus Cloacimonadota bacterium]MDY0128192.1 biotin/lipoyl-containing protein [Candidatus Cloacimonadaceae bacterium]MCB5255015.1 biotin/lipoyl-binding protein [Candidatus Cloacimonadota bacterium]MCK9179140.1 biotin/lipoyl-binding protein [Candidatus Cloacimonadota bacterium]MCK9242733.1 biotin/lipoyl-binding protein [Candidatus Cloacimonadota bacterium]
MKTYKLIINGERYEASVVEYSSSHAKININGHDYLIQIEQDHSSEVPKLERRDKSVPMAPSFSSGVDMSSGEVRAPLPGVIVSIPVKEGDLVVEGQAILIIEAMKMESEIASPVDARIARILVKERSLVQEDDVIMILESIEDTSSPKRPPKASKVQSIQSIQPTAAPVAKSSDLVLRAPIPGSIIDVSVNVGQAVHEGDVAVILEAMKMESDIHFESKGKVKKIYVSRGDNVQEGDPLIELEG